eukprot:m.193434 g.193434  ORF g.193434 m.193434 type:complete len:279 (+) comp18917_c0_seq1:240-1076(+)
MPVSKMSTGDASKNIFTSEMANAAAEKVKSKEFKSLGDYKESHGRQAANEFEPGRRLEIPKTTPRVCAFCGERARCACPVCLTALYCNRDCQVNHYTIHQANCAQLAAQPSAAQLTDVARKRDTAPQNGGAETSTASPAPAAAAPVRKPKKEKAAAKQPQPQQQQQQSTPPNDKEKQRGSYTVFKCEQCDKVFKQSSSLKTHMRSHSGIKPFVCQVCGKNFSASFALRRHERIHTGEKAFKCSFCGKDFSRKDALKQHERVHSKDGSNDEESYADGDG